MRQAISTLENSRDLIDLGAYVSGKNLKLDAAIQAEPEIEALLCQATAVNAPFDETNRQLRALAGKL